jgi:hypothetical protein
MIISNYSHRIHEICKLFFILQQLYADVSQIESIIKVSTQSLGRSTQFSNEIQERIDYFDTGARITGNYTLYLMWVTFNYRLYHRASTRIVFVFLFFVPFTCTGIWAHGRCDRSTRNAYSFQALKVRVSLDCSIYLIWTLIFTAYFYRLPD